MREETALALAGSLVLLVTFLALLTICSPPPTLVGYDCEGDHGPQWSSDRSELGHCRVVERTGNARK